jgi:hypothetical protein
VLLDNDEKERKRIEQLRLIQGTRIVLQAGFASTTSMRQAHPLLRHVPIDERMKLKSGELTTWGYDLSLPLSNAQSPMLNNAFVTPTTLSPLSSPLHDQIH